MREMRDFCSYSCLGCGEKLTEREMHMRSGGPIIFGEPRPIPLQELYLSCLIAAEGPVIHRRTP